jgi:hypothetical protein
MTDWVMAGSREEDWDKTSAGPLGKGMKGSHKIAGGLKLCGFNTACNAPALADEFGFPGHALAVTAAVLGSIGVNAGAGFIRAFPRLGHGETPLAFRYGEAPNEST